MCGTFHTLQLLHRQTKLAFPFDPEISCSSWCFCSVIKNVFGDGNTSGYTFWFKLTVLEWTSRHDPHMTCDGMNMSCYRSIEYIDFQRGHTPLELTPLELSTHGKEIFIMIIGGLDVCDAFKFHRDEDTEFLNYKRGGQGLIGRCGARGRVDLRPLWCR